MSEHDTPVVKSADDPAFKLPASLAALSLPLTAVGAVVLLAGWAVGFFGADARIGMSAYLTAFIYCLTITIGCLFFVLIQHLARAGWSAVVRRIAELVMVMIIPLAVLFLPIAATLLMGDGTLYRWDDPHFAEHHHIDAAVWSEKVRWLDQSWFIFRAVVYFAIWIGLALYFYRGSERQDQTGERAITDRLQYWSGPATMAFSLTTTFAAFDWVMSLAPMWFSTMFGVYLFAGSVLSAHCAIAVGSYVLQKKGALRDEITVEHYHDLGKLIFGFIFFWTYISFSQYLLIWYGNIPEETEWFYHRQVGVWGGVALVLIFLHWMLPFLGTMSRHVRRRPWAVFGWSIYVLIMHYVDVFWMIMPEGHEAIVRDPAYAPAPANFTVVSIAAAVLCVLGMVTLMIGLILQKASQTKIVAVRDPRFRESIAFENI